MTGFAACYREPDIRRRLWLLLAMAALWLPLGNLPLWRYLYGFTGELSPATWILFFVWFGFPGVFRAWCHAELPFKRRIALLGAMILFYVLALGSGPFDPYAYGFQPWVLLALLAAWVARWGRRAVGLTLLLSVDLMAFGLHWLGSTNLWDYLVDPVLMIALGISVFRGVMSRRFNSTK
jgi:hypothetical protein